MLTVFESLLIAYSAMLFSSDCYLHCGQSDASSAAPGNVLMTGNSAKVAYRPTFQTVKSTIVRIRTQRKNKKKKKKHNNGETEEHRK